ncbi:hypothetical protein D3C84_925080 [compost metagenome]
MSTEKFQSIFDQWKENDRIISEQVKLNGENFMKEMLKVVYDQNPGLERIVFLGWTPSFNDGEPCEHRDYVYVGKSSSYSDGSVYFDYSDYSEVEEFFTDDEGDKYYNADLKNFDEVIAQVESVLEIIRRIHTTNFMVSVSLDESGEVQVDVDEYDPGY